MTYNVFGGTLNPTLRRRNMTIIIMRTNTDTHTHTHTHRITDAAKRFIPVTVVSEKSNKGSNTQAHSHIVDTYLHFTLYSDSWLKHTQQTCTNLVVLNPLALSSRYRG